MKKAENMPLRALAVSVLCGALIALLLMLGGALAVYAQKLGAALVPQAALACVGIGALVSGLLAARLAGANRFLWGLAGAGALFACMVLLSLLCVGSPIRPARLALNGAVMLLSGGIGSFAGSNLRRKKHRKK